MLAHRLNDLVARRLRVVSHKGKSRHDVTGYAVSALHRLVVDKGLLHGMETVLLRDTFNRLDVLSVDIPNGCDAGSGWHPGDEHRASATFTLTAAKFRACEVKVFAKHIEQGAIRVGGGGTAVAVNGQSVLDWHGQVPEGLGIGRE